MSADPGTISIMLQRDSSPEPVRACLEVDGRRLSYLDFGGPGRPLLALHGHFNEGRTFTQLARALGPDWRVVAPDQRGHGYSDRPADYSREGYIADAAAVLDHLGLDQAMVLGHSLGGINAYQLAARHPHRVSALVIEDIGAEVDPDGWGLAFRPQDMVVSVGLNNGDHWEDWLATDCPALVVQGIESDTLSADHAEAMVGRRPNTRLVQLATGHTVHESDPAGFAACVRTFLDTL